jgi:hypothetical protein
MRYKVTVKVYESQEADTPEEAKEKFLMNFIFADLEYGEWKIEQQENNNA